MAAHHQPQASGHRTPEYANPRYPMAPHPTPSSRNQHHVQQQIQQQQIQHQQQQQDQQRQLQLQLQLQLQQLQLLQLNQQVLPQQQSSSPRPSISRFAAAIEGESDAIDVKSLQRQVGADTGTMLYVMKRQKRKEVWNFVRLVRKEVCWEISREDLTNDHADSAYCLLCNTTFKFRIGKSKVPQHMDAYHPSELAAYIAQREQQARGDGAPVIRNLANAFDAVANPSTKRPLRTITPQEQKRVNELLAEWVARHFRPMVIVEDAGFIAFVEFITVHLGGVSLTIPKREKLRQDIIALAEEYRRRVRKCIASGCLYYSITCDIWTARTAKSYISLTIHYVDEEFTPKNWTLEVRLFPGIHDGTTISAMITRILEEWSLPKRFCVKLLRDSGANMVAASKKLNIEHMACIAHSLHLVVAGSLIKKSKTASGNVIPEWAEDVAAESSTNVAEREEEATLSKEDRAEIEGLQELAIDEMEEFLDSTIAGLHRNEMDSLRTIVQNFRTLAVYFRKSSKGNNRLGAIQIQHFNIKPENVLSPIVDCPTRWNSCWKMLDQLIALEAPLMKFFAHLKQPEGRKEFKDMEKKLRRPKPEEWFSIKCLQKLLGPFATASDTLGGQTYPTTPLILPVLSGIRKHLERVDLFDVLAAEAGDEEFVFDTTFMMNECRKAMLTLFDKRFRALEESELKWIAFLDPRVAKRMPHLNPTDTPKACKDIVEAMVELAQEVSPREDCDSPVAAPVQANSYMHDHIFGPDVVPIRATKLDEDCDKEFTRYLGAVTMVKSSTNPFEWWRVNSSNYPNLSRLARKWLGTVATSVPSERAFSTSGNILTVKRSSLAPEMVRDLVFVAANWRISDN